MISPELMCNRCLILKNNESDFEQYFSENMKGENIDVSSIYKIYPKIILLIRSLHYRSKLPFRSIWYDIWKRKISEYEIIIIFDVILDTEIIKYIKDKNKNIRIIFWYWNTIKSSKEILNIKKYSFCEVWSFDTKDCRTYDLKQNTQFYFPV